MMSCTDNKWGSRHDVYQGCCLNWRVFRDLPTAHCLDVLCEHWFAAVSLCVCVRWLWQRENRPAVNFWWLILITKQTGVLLIADGGVWWSDVAQFTPVTCLTHSLPPSTPPPPLSPLVSTCGVTGVAVQPHPSARAPAEETSVKHKTTLSYFSEDSTMMWRCNQAPTAAQEKTNGRFLNLH